MKDHQHNRSARARTVKILFLVSIFAACSFAFMKYQKKIEFSFVHFKKALHENKSSGEVRCFIATNIEGRHYLRLKIAVPCANRKQRLELTRNLPRFENEVLMEMSDPRMRRAVEKRNFETLRYRLIEILNTCTSQPVKDVYFESFFYN